MTISDKEWRKLAKHAEELIAKTSALSEAVMVEKPTIKEITFDKEAARAILIDALSKGNKLPGMFELPKLIDIKNKLETCDNVSDVVDILGDNYAFILDSFDLSETDFDNAIDKLWNIK